MSSSRIVFRPKYNLDKNSVSLLQQYVFVYSYLDISVLPNENSNNVTDSDMHPQNVIDSEGSFQDVWAWAAREYHCMAHYSLPSHSHGN
jgi:hypothetical protein